MHTGAITAERTRIERPRWRSRLVRGFVAVVLVGQAVLIVRGYSDPHKFFAFQPFNESSTWSAEIVRVTADGQRIPIAEPWPGGYEWDDLVDWGVLEAPDREKHAYSGLDATTDFLGKALDWVADNTPGDRETRYLEATVTGTRNTRGPERLVLRSGVREEAS